MAKIPQSKFIKVISKTNGRCFYCNKPAEVVDHFISKQKYKDWGLVEYCGSPDVVENLFPACNSCNSSKSDLPPEDFIGNAYRTWKRYYKANWRAGLELEHREWVLKTHFNLT